MSASDGAFDELSEGLQAEINISGLADGQHTIHMRAKDSAGNWSSDTLHHRFIISLNFQDDNPAD